MILRSFFVTLFLLVNTQGLGASAQASKQVVPAAQVADIVDQTKEIEQLRQERDQARVDKAIAEAKNEVIDAGNSRLENWIGAFGILITLLVIGFSIATYRVAASEATKVARKELEDAHQEINEIRKSIINLETDVKNKAAEVGMEHEKVINISKELEEVVAQSNTPNLSENLSPDLQKEFDEAAEEVEAKPPAQRTPIGLKILLSKALQASNYDRMTELAEELIEKADDDDDKIFAYSYWGSALNQLGKYEEAIAKYGAALTINPDHYQSLYNWGNELYALGKPEEAIAKYEAALDINPDDYQSLTNWGVALAKLGNYEETIAKYEAALDIKPDEYQILANWGGALTELGNYEEAIAKYEAALDIKPDEYQILYNWGGTLVELAKKKRGKNREELLEQAEDKCTKANTLKDGAGSYNLACIYALRKDAQRTADWLRDAKEKDSNIPNCDEIAEDKDFNAIRKTPEFKQAMKDIGCA